MYIPPPIDELTHEEVVDEDTCDSREDLPDNARSYEISATLPNTSEKLNK